MSVPRRSLPLAAARLSAELQSLSRPAELGERASPGAVRCTSCAHRCRLKPGQRGVCGVRFNHEGTLYAPWGYVSRRYIRPVETNTIFHVHPGALALTFGMYGCDLRCPYCHNWYLSQALRESTEERATDMTPAALVSEALAAGAEVLCAAYNEPLISAEWMHAIFREAGERGLTTAVITDGHSTPEVLGYIHPVTDVVRIDLKVLDDRAYRTLGGRLEPVLDTLRRAHAMGFWLEVVTLVVPGLNDDAGMLREMASLLVELDPDIPWHLNAAQPRYRHDAEPPSTDFLLTAAGAAYVRGLRHVYVGNVPAASALAHTRCPECHAVTVRRTDFRTTHRRLDRGRCPECSTPLAGLWDARHAAWRRARIGEAGSSPAPRKHARGE
jgi:pyruvate formate lyase activating enzyme